MVKRFQGPTRPGTDVETFRKTGVSRRRGGGDVFLGPVRPGRDEELFRQTGRSIELGSPEAQRVRKQLEQQKKDAQQKLLKEQEAVESKRAAQRVTQERQARLLREQRLVAERRLREKAKEEAPKKDEFLTQRQTGTIKGTPIFETIVVDANGKFIRKATTSEQKEIIEAGLTAEAGRPEFETKREEKLFDIETKQQNLRNKKKREGSLSAKDELKLAKLESQRIGLELLLSVKGLGAFFSAIKKDPSILKEVPSALKDEAKRTAKIIQLDPTSGLIKVGAEILFFKGTGKVIKVLGKVGTKATTRLSPKFKKIKSGTINIPSQAKGKTLKIEVLRPGLGKILEPIPKQVKLAGKKISVVTSAQADRLVTLFKSQKTVRKPIPNENLLSKSTKKLLKRFDDGRITRNQLIILDRRIQKETKGAGNLLERSFFVDPKGRVRLSRLGIEESKEASLLDILAGDVSFRAQKPQILIFENIRVQAFPKTKIFKSIKSKLKSGKTLTTKEGEALLKFQLKPSGKFKPLGALSKEPELTVSPSDIIKKKKVVGVTLVNGKKVQIVRAEVVKASKQTQKLLKKSRKGKLTSKELRRLNRNLKKETGFKSSLSRATKRKPVVPVRRLALTALTKTISGRRVARGKVRRKPSRRRIIKRKVRRIPRPGRTRPRRISRPKRVPRKISRPGPRPRPRRIPRPRIPGRPPPPIRRLPRGVPKKGLLFPRKVTKKKKSKKKQKSYHVFARPLKASKKAKRRKLIRVSKAPLSKRRAKDLRNFIVDRSLSRTGRIIRAKGKPRKLVGVPQGFAKRTSQKFRRFKIRKGKRVRIPKGVVIEKARRSLDTKSERAGLTLKRRIALLRKAQRPRRITRSSFPRTRKQSGLSSRRTQRRISSPVRINNVKRKASPQQLRNLAKGRKIRMQNLKRK